MRVLIDRKSLQAHAHKTRGKNRLGAFLKVVGAASGVKPEFSDGAEGELQPRRLSAYKLLVVLTRRPILPFDIDELLAIEDFVRKGGSLLLMSNHAPLKHNDPDFIKHDKELARIYGVILDGPAYKGKFAESGLHVEVGGKWWPCAHIEGRNLVTHSITEGLDEGVLFDDSCRMRLARGSRAEVLATLPGVTEDAGIFAVALDNPCGNSSGRVVITANSGFIGNAGTIRPGPGLIGQKDNSKFIQQIVEWLCHKR